MGRKFIFAALACSLILALSACGEEQSGNDTVESGQEVASEVTVQPPTVSEDVTESAQDDGTANPSEADKPAESTQGADWNAAYQDFILQKGWLQAEKGADLGEDPSVVVFLLHDLDGNGVPEILARNEVADFGERGNYVYAWDGNSLAFLGEIGFLGGTLWESDTSTYPGLFHYAGLGDSYLGHYYDVKDGQLRQTLIVTDVVVPSGDSFSYETTVETTDNDLYETYSRTKGSNALPMYTAEEISAMSWERFVR